MRFSETSVGGDSRSDLGRHAGDTLRCDVPTQDVAAQLRILLVLQVGDSAPKTSFIFDVGRLKLSEDLWRPQESRSTHRRTHTVSTLSSEQEVWTNGSNRQKPLQD